MAEFSTRLSVVERNPPVSVASLSAPSPLYGLPGYGGIPPSTSVVVHTSAPQLPIPITQISFPHSPSPIPALHSSTPELPHEDHDDARGVPRFYKMPFPTYDGKEDPLGWLNRCDHFFRAQNIRDADKVGLASFHMLGIAQHWFHMLERDAGPDARIGWNFFKTLCQQRFGPPLGTNHLSDLARLPFQGSVANYQEAFQAKMAHAGSLAPDQQVQLFTGGLPEPLRTDVELQQVAATTGSSKGHESCSCI